MGMVKISVKALGPLYLGGVRAPGSNMLRSERYISGGVLRAALVGAAQAGKVTEEAIRPWLDPDGSSEAGSATLPHLYPVPLALMEQEKKAEGASPGVKGATDKAPGFVSVVTPLSACRCKKKGGLPTAGEPMGDSGHVHGALDLLLHELAFSLACQGNGPKGVPIPFEMRCGAENRSCREPLTPLEAAWIVHDGTKWGHVPTEVLRHTRVAIQRQRRSAQDEMLFSVESLPPEMCFSGMAWVPDKARKNLEQALSSITHLGGRVNTGYGAVEITIKDVRAELAGKVALEKRLEEFQSHLGRLFESYRLLSDPKSVLDGNRRFFSVDVHTPLIRTDEADADSLALPAEALREALQAALRETTPDPASLERSLKRVAAARLEAVTCHVAPQRIGGWHTGRRLPVPVRLGTRAGSYYVFETSATDLEGLTTGLVALERVGLGERREDGFGRVMVAHPFHLETGAWG